jgi:uroporphyrinogen decarboxylase
MDKRIKFLKALRREAEDYIPFEFSLCPSKTIEYKNKYGYDDYAGQWGFPFKWDGADYIGDKTVFMKYHDSDKGMGVDDWGIGYVRGNFEHFSYMRHPMKNFTALHDFEQYPYPDSTKDYRWDTVSERINALHKNGVASVAGMQITIFECAWYLRGMEAFMVDMIEEPAFAHYHLDRITAVRAEFAKRYAEMGFDMLFLGDDVATQLNMMFSLETWRTFFKPRLADIIRSAKTGKPDIIIGYHSDGNAQAIIPELIEIGVDVLNPVQPECMDPVEIKRIYGDRLSFWGTVGTQTTLPFGTPGEVRAFCEKMIKEVGKGGGLVLAPTHLVEPEVPLENIQAFIDTVTEYNNDL